MGLHLPAEECRGTTLQVNVDPYLPRSRPALDTQVWINGRLATTWRFRRDDSDKTPEGSGDVHVLIPVNVQMKGDEHCDVEIAFRFLRPYPRPAVIPSNEDPRDLQLRVQDAGVGAPSSVPR